MSPTRIDPDQSLAEIMANFPGARRALFRHYHIGGCSSCAFSPGETLAALCLRNENIDPREVMERIVAGHEEEQKLLIDPPALAGAMKGAAAPVLVDVRSREEFDAVSIPGAVFMTQNWMRELMGEADREKALVFYDHLGEHVLETVSYFAGHGFCNVRGLRGGIEAWSLQVDPQMPRYRLEQPL